MVYKIINIVDNSFWKQDIDRAIAEFQAQFNTTPYLIVGVNFIQEIMMERDFIRLSDTFNSTNSKNMKSIYKGIECLFDEDLTNCVIITDEEDFVK